MNKIAISALLWTWMLTCVAASSASQPERFKNPVVEGEEEFAGKRCVKIRMNDELDHPCHVFFHKDSHLLGRYGDCRSAQ